MHATSSAAARPQGWLRFFLPSFSDVIFLILLGSLSYGVLSPRLLQDGGTGWHIRNGELILRTHSITRVDPFSSTMHGQPWYAWEWFYDVVIAAIHVVSGLNGVVFFSAIVIALTFALTFHLALARGGHFAVTVLLLLLSISAATIHFFARPHVLSWLMVVVWFYVLDSANNNSANGRLFWLPFLMLLWANMHGGFLTGFALLACFFLGGLREYFRAQDSGRREAMVKYLSNLSVVALLCFVASLINPYGYKLYTHIYGYLTNRFLMTHIDEFLSPNFHGIAQQCFLLLVVITLVVLARARTRPLLSELLIILFAVAGGLYASRNLPVAGILLTLIVAPLWGNRVAASETSFRHGLQKQYMNLRMSTMEKQFRAHLWPLVLVLGGVGICLHQGRFGQHQVMDASFSGQRFPLQAAEAIAQRHIPGPIFSPDYMGGYLIYRLYPDVQVVVDDRHDLYGEEFFKKYLKIVHVEPGWDEALQKYNVDWVLTPVESPLAAALSTRADWIVEDREDNAVLFRHKSTF